MTSICTISKFPSLHRACRDFLQALIQEHRIEELFRSVMCVCTCVCLSFWYIYTHIYIYVPICEYIYVCVCVYIYGDKLHYKYFKSTSQSLRALPWTMKKLCQANDDREKWLTGILERSGSLCAHCTAVLYSIKIWCFLFPNEWFYYITCIHIYISL